KLTYLDVITSSSSPHCTSAAAPPPLLVFSSIAPPIPAPPVPLLDQDRRGRRCRIRIEKGRERVAFFTECRRPLPLLSSPPPLSPRLQLFLS
ncbi:hypothetical protein BHM03_00043437, partial [Ensete ventricosum]